MAQVFLSFHDSDRDRVETIADGLKDLGLTVWLATDQARQDNLRRVEEELIAADAVLVCWSGLAARSKHVFDEVYAAQGLKKLVSCVVAGDVRSRVPHAFSMERIRDLRAWFASPFDGGDDWRALIEDIVTLTRKPEPLRRRSVRGPVGGPSGGLVPRRQVARQFGPINLDLSALYTAGGAYEERADELAWLGMRWADNHAAKLEHNPDFRAYQRFYGHFTPLSVMPIPEGLPRENLPPVLDGLPASAAILAGRLIVADVEGPAIDQSEKRSSRGYRGEWRRLELGENNFVGPLNSSPISERRFDELMAHVERCFRRIVSSWRRNLRTTRKLYAGEPDIGRAPEPPDHPFFFVSYARSNDGRVASLCEELKRAGAPLWRDTTSIQEGEHVVTSIRRALDTCEGVISFCSAEHSASKWCLREIMYADDLPKPILPAWLTDPALSGDMKFMLLERRPVVVERLSPPDAARLIMDGIRTGLQR